MTQLYIQKTSTTPERLAGWILDRLEGNEEPAEVHLPFSKQHLASFLGTSPENLSRAISSLRAVGTVMHKRKILISDIDGLRRVASGEAVQAASDTALPGIGV